MTLFQELVGELSRAQGELSFRQYGDGATGRKFLRVQHVSKHVVVSWSPTEGTVILSHPYAPDIRWMRDHQQADVLMGLLNVEFEPYRQVPARSIKPEEIPLLPLARLVAGNVYAAQDPHADPHLAMRIVDGLHDYFPEVWGALDGLTAAVEQGYWRLQQLSWDKWDSAAGDYQRVHGPQPAETIFTETSES